MVVKCPVLIAPAMNEAMYLHEQTQLNIQKLKAQGVHFIEPEKGYLACQDEGWGRLASPEQIVSEAAGLIKKSLSLKGKTVLVTAGPTREYLDPVRFLSNPASGKMGFELAEEALRRGAEVILVAGPTLLTPPSGARVKPVQTAAQMSKEVENLSRRADVIIMAAAVSDFRFADTSNQKIKKQNIPEMVRLQKNPDILKKLGSRKGNKILVGFAAETQNVKENALRKLKEKNLDMIVANDVSKKGFGFGTDFNQVSLVYPDGKAVRTGKKSKREISRILFDALEKLYGDGR
jgi:phosphopantothenoylcysteine decarboxylase/phosphopantothenate--cysteine ligase